MGDEWLACGAVLVASLMQLQWPPLCCAVLVAGLLGSVFAQIDGSREEFECQVAGAHDAGECSALLDGPAPGAAQRGYDRDCQ